MCVDYLLSLPTCNGRVGATGMCLGGHLAYRCALDSRVKAAVCYFATDIHSKTLGLGKNDDSLARAGDIKGEMLMVRSDPCLFILSSPLRVREGISSANRKDCSCVVADFWKERHPCSARGKGFDPQDPS